VGLLRYRKGEYGRPALQPLPAINKRLHSRTGRALDDQKTRECGQPSPKPALTSSCSSCYPTSRVPWSKKAPDVSNSNPLVGMPILHDELGLVKDWLTRLENFADCQVEIVLPDEVATREHLVIRTNDLEDFLSESEELQPKESIKISKASSSNRKCN
jgi:hypothetical protein